MKFNQWPKRDPIKNYFPVPNEIYCLGLEAGEIAIYGYLLYLEDRKTYQCWPSYKTIGRAVKMSPNTVRKYVVMLEEKDLIYTEPTMIRRKDGRPMNGSLLYTIRPIQEALNVFYERQMFQVDQQCIAEKLEKRVYASHAKSSGLHATSNSADRVNADGSSAAISDNPIDPASTG